MSGRDWRRWTTPVSSAGLVWLWVAVTALNTLAALLHLFKADYEATFRDAFLALLAGLYVAEQHSRRVEHGVFLPTIERPCS